MPKVGNDLPGFGNELEGDFLKGRQRDDFWGAFGGPPFESQLHEWTSTAPVSPAPAAPHVLPSSLDSPLERSGSLLEGLGMAIKVLPRHCTERSKVTLMLV